ncbi:MAG: hypothetical protein IPK94_08960 [Saprospiraceae bacterium]|nr:hypothetical protein [Saprospiraceae bacterium]
MPVNVKFIFTAIPGEETANLSKRKGIKVEELKAVTKIDAEEIISAICKRYHKNLDKAVTGVLLNIKIDEKAYAYSNPLWLNMAVDEFLLLDEDDFGGMKAYAGTAEEKLKQLLLTTAHEMPAGIEGMYAYLFDKTRQRFGKDFVNAFFSYIAISRYGLRESDLEKLITEYSTLKWDDLKFAALRRYLRAHLVRKGEVGLWDFRHVQVRAGINQLLLSSNEQKIILHSHIASHLEALPKDDSLPLTEILWNLFKAADTQKAAEIYGSFWWDTIQTKEHSKSLVDIILDDDRNVQWITSLTALEDLDEDIKEPFNNNFLFTLSDQLKDTVKLGEQKFIYLSVVKSTQSSLSRNPDSADYARDCPYRITR